MRRTIAVGGIALAVLAMGLTSAHAQGPAPPDGPRRGDRPRGIGGRGEEAAPFETATHPKDDAEAASLEALHAIQSEQGRRMNVPAVDGRMLRMMAEALGAKKVVEFGTSNGISAIWMALALRKTDGHLITHEIDPDTAALARKNFDRAGVADRVTVVVGDGHAMAKKLEGPIDMVFLDADKEGYLDYYRQTLPLMRPGGLILAHNMNPRMADPAFVKEITTSPDVETVFFMQGGGMSMTLKKR